MRFFFLEPFLSRTESHFIEVAVAVNAFFQENREHEFYLIGNKKLNASVADLLPGVIAGVSQTCFEDMNDGGRTFGEDLLSLNEQFNFREDDLLVVQTSYENQLLGVVKFEAASKTRPMIALQFHQLFPPATESDDVGRPTFRKLWIGRLREAFSQVESPRVSFWTTESERLHRDFCRVSRKRVGMLPVPFIHNTNTAPSDALRGRPLVGYLGDGRQEKGLLLWLKAMEELNRSGSEYRFIIQVNNPRGYSEEQRRQFDSLLEYVAHSPNTQIIHGPISHLRFHLLLQSLDILVLPYNPINYFRRVSGLAMHAAVYHKPVLASRGTWAASAIQKGHVAGIVFEYEKGDEERTISNINASLGQYARDQSFLKEDAVRAAPYFANRNRPDVYVDRLLAHYGRPVLPAN